jgi:hypothetical protein
MAKRAPAGEGTYNPLDATLAQSVIQGTAAPEGRMTAEGTQSNGAAETPRSPRFSLTAKETSHSRGTLAKLPEAERTRSLSREKRVLLTSEEERQVERLVDRVGEGLGTSLKLSHLMRACMAVLCHAEEELLRHALDLQPLSRPANGDAVALAQFEQALNFVSTGCCVGHSLAISMSHSRRGSPTSSTARMLFGRPCTAGRSPRSTSILFSSIPKPRPFSEWSSSMTGLTRPLIVSGAMVF